MESHTDNHSSRFVERVKPTAFVNALSLGLIFLSQVFLARLMGAEQYGLYVYAISWIAIVVILGKSGLDITLQRYIPEYISKKMWSLAHGILARSYTLAAMSGFTLAFLGGAAALMLQGSIVISFTLLVTSLAIIPVWICAKITQGALLAFKKPVTAQFADGLVQPALLMGLMAFAYFSSGTLVGADTAMGASLLAWIAALIFGFFVLTRTGLPREVRIAQPDFRTGEWVQYSLPVLFISGTQVVMSHTDVIMVGFLIGTTEAGIYAAASRLATLVTLGLVLVNMIFSPYISELHHSGKTQELQKLAALGVRIGSAFAIPAALCLWLFGDSFLTVFGPEFSHGYIVLAILAISALVNVVSGSVGYIMNMTGHQRPAAQLLGASCVMNIILNLLLIPPMGIAGAAIATACSVITWNIAMALFVGRHIGINPTILAAFRKT